MVVTRFGFSSSSPFILAAISIMLLVACSSSALPDTPAPTHTLVPPSATPPPVTPPPTETPAPAIRAASLVEAVPPSLDALEDEQERTIAIQIYQDLAARREADGHTGELRLVVLEPSQWSSARLLGCPQTLAPQTIEGYRVVFVTDHFIYEYHTGPQQTIRLCSVRDVSEAEDDVLLLIDPIAAEMYTLAQQRISRERDIPSRLVELGSMTRVTWPDSALGCYSADLQEQIQPIMIDGYRLVIVIGEEEMIFHTDSESIRQCAPEDEVLPSSSPDNSQEPTSTPS